MHKFTESDLKALKEAIAHGSRVVEYADRRSEYRTLDEMIRIKNMIEKELMVKKENTNIKFKYSSGY